MSTPSLPLHQRGRVWLRAAVLTTAFLASMGLFIFRRPDSLALQAALILSATVVTVLLTLTVVGSDRLKRTGFVAGPAVTVATLLIGWATIPEPPTASSVNSLSLEVARPEEGERHYVVPFNAPFETFPQTPSKSVPCANDAQQKWLAKYGRLRPNGFTFLVRNTADTGGTLTLDDLEIDGRRVKAATPGLIFSCLGQGAGYIAEVSVNLASDRPVVRLKDPTTGRLRPFVVNLAPGEENVLDITLIAKESSSYQGSFSMRVSAGKATRRLTIGDFTYSGGALSGLAITANTGDRKPFHCTTLKVNKDCDIADLKRLITHIPPP